MLLTILLKVFDNFLLTNVLISACLATQIYSFSRLAGVLG
jgi:hypothetical protein